MFNFRRLASSLQRGPQTVKMMSLVDSLEPRPTSIMPPRAGQIDLRGHRESFEQDIEQHKISSRACASDTQNLA